MCLSVFLSQALSKFLLSVNWADLKEASEAHRLLPKWASISPEVSPRFPLVPRESMHCQCDLSIGYTAHVMWIASSAPQM